MFVKEFKTKQMRTEVELLELLKRAVKGVHYSTGLCPLTHVLCRHEIIDANEYHELMELIRNNPRRQVLMPNSLFYFTIGETKPRLEYLDELINQYKNIQK